MNKYTKPTFMLASLGVNALAAGGGCSIQAADKEIIMDVLGDDFAQAFENYQDCGMVVEGLIESYCKFTSLDLSEAKAFFS